MGDVGRNPQLFGVLVTFRRPALLVTALEAITGQTLPLDHLIVVDNSPSPDTREIVRDLAPDAEYVPAPENLGPAGGIALGMERLLEMADDQDWILTLDDDDPPPSPTLFAELHEFALDLSHRDRHLGGIGLEGVRFDRRRGRIIWVPDDELHGAVPVDSIGGRDYPRYRAGAIRAIGPMRKDLFFGFEELEFGLRLRDAGYSLYAPGPLWYASREADGRLGMRFVPSRSLGYLTWRRYYSLRNLVAVLRDSGATMAAIRVTLVVGIAKPLANLVREPRRALHHLWLNVRACRDAWTRRMGRTIEPPS